MYSLYSGIINMLMAWLFFDNLQLQNGLLEGWGIGVLFRKHGLRVVYFTPETQTDYK